MFKTRMKIVVAVTFVLVVMAISGTAQSPNQASSQTAAPDAEALLKRVGETYRSLKSYHFEGRFTQEQLIESMGLKDESKREELFVIAAIKPGSSRIESKNPHFSLTSVSDGKTKWVYMPGPNEYTKTWEAAARTATPPLPTQAESILANARNIMAGYSRIDYRLREARFVGEEKLKIGEWQVDCFVIEAEYITPAADRSSAWTRKLWIDKSRNIILREIKHTKARVIWEKTIHTKISYVFNFANLDEQVTEALFTFVRPEGSKEVAELRSPSRPAVTPRPAATPSPNPPAPGAGIEEPANTPSSPTVRLPNAVIAGEAIKRVQPQYPSEARRARVQGPVQVEITVSESGKVIEAKAISGHELLRAAAVEAAKQWEFKPSEVSGAPVKVREILTFTFNLQ